MYRYQAFGLKIASELELLDLSPFPSEELPDLLIREGRFSESRPGEARFSFTVPGVGAFLVESGKVVTFERAEAIDTDSLQLFLLGSCFGAALQQKGFLVLHGNAVSLDGETCEIFVGNRGAGKSTSAAWHYLNGATILADDVCAITFNSDGKPIVLPSFPRIKLWQASADLLGISTAPLRRVRPGTEKFSLPVREQFSPKPLLLKKVSEISATSGFSPLAGAQKLSRLLAHSYRYSYVQKMGLAPGYNRKLLQLANTVEVQSAPRIPL